MKDLYGLIEWGDIGGNMAGDKRKVWRKVWKNRINWKGLNTFIINYLFIL